MRLQKQQTRKVGNTVYSKYVVVIPTKIVEESKFKEGEELKIRAE